MDIKRDWTTVLQVVEEVLEKGEAILFEKLIDSKVIPYQLQQTLETLKELLRFQVFPRDPGNDDMNLWVPDEEPPCPKIDSWARFAIPIKSLTPYDITKHEEILKPVKKARKSVLPPPSKKTSVSLVLPSAAPSAVEPLSKPPSRIEKKVQIDPIQEENKRMLVRIQNMQKEGQKVHYAYDHNGRIVIVTHVQPSKLVTMGVKAVILSEESLTTEEPTIVHGEIPTLATDGILK